MTTTIDFYDNRDEIDAADCITKDDDYDILATDEERTFYLDGAGANKVFTMPPLADSQGKIYRLINLDSTYELQAAGYSSQNFYYRGTTQNTIDIELEGSGIVVMGFPSFWLILYGIGVKFSIIGSTIEVIYKVFLSGTTDNDSQTNIAHGIGDRDKITRATGQIQNGATNRYDVYENREASSAINAFIFTYTTTNIVFLDVGTNHQGENYRVKLDYYI
ncbi:MAG: hypothetical protein ACFFDN_16865 [Candidatus Hodarchaeota archaeon]